MIRNLHLTDFLKLGRLHEANVGLDVLGSLVMSHSLRSAALSQHLPVPVQSFNSSIYILEEPEGKPCAFVQARARQRRDEWDILALGTIGKSFEVVSEPTATSSENENTTETSSSETAQSPSSPDNSNDISNTENLEIENQVEAIKAQTGVEQANVVEIVEDEDENVSWPSISEAEVAWLKLLEHLIVDAGERGVLRIYARLIEDSPEIELFNQTGFHTFTHEALFRLNYKTALEKPGEIKLRPQRGRDLFPIDQLYRAITPGLVQHADNTSSRSWSLSRNYFPRPLKEQGFVLEENNKVVAYLRLLNHRNKHQMSIMCLDNRREILPEVIRFGLTSIKAGDDVQIYCAVRDYQSEQTAILEEFGFEYFGKQAAMVKHIVQYIKNPEKALAHVRDHKLELAHSVVIKHRKRHLPKIGHFMW